MSDCCCPDSPTTVQAQCPRCGSKGIAVELQTVKALLVPPAMRRLAVTHHRFCPSPHCAVVYFDDGGRTYGREDLRVPVWQKEPEGDRTICYCFDETETAIRDEIARTGCTKGVDRVREHIAAARCACDIRNPKGSCCLGDMIAAVKRVEAAILAKSEPR